jgi:peroxiredoxin
LGGLVLGLVAIVFWRPLQQRCLVALLLRAEAPSEEVLSGAVEQSSAPATTLTALWRTQRIPHRQFVVNYLNRVSASSPDLLHAMEPLVLEAAVDPDIGARESAFAILTKMKHPQLRTLALEQMSDADPAARLLGLQNLRSIASSNDVAIALGLLKDPEPRVVAAAAQVLRQATGQDFGIKSTHALPHFYCFGTNPPPAPDLAAILEGVRRSEAWWQTHRAEYLGVPAKPAPPRRPNSLATGDFTFKNAEDKPTRLSEFRGKAVLLWFWSAGVPASLEDAPALKHLQQRYSDQLAVLGICIPAASSCGDEHEPGHEHPQHHDESAGAKAGTEHMHCSVQDAVTRLNLNYPMLADLQGALAQRFSIGDLPAYVLIDAHGMIRRRFVGFRTESVLAAMLREL